MSRRRVALAGLILLAAALRLWGLGDAPPGLHPDEAVNAFEARSVAQTLTSTDGRRYPLTFQMHRRFWTEGTYVWLAAPFTILPLPVEVTTRLPAALAGILLVPLVYLLGGRLLGGNAALAAAALIAVQPYAVHYSRIGLRATLIPALLTGGLVLAFEAAARKEGDRAGLVLAVAGGALLSLALVTYTPARVFVPLLLAAFSGFACVRFLSPRWFLIVLPSCAAFALTLTWLLYGDGASRLDSVAAETPWDVVSGYALHYSPRMLFWGSSSKGFWAENVSPLLWIEAPLLILGLVSLARRGRSPDGSSPRFLLAWFLLFPVASAFTVPAPNPMRAIFAVPLLALVGAEGFRFAWALASERAAQRRLTAVVVALGLVCGASAAYSYFVRFPAEERRFWYAGYPDAIRGALVEADARGATLKFISDLRRSPKLALVELYARDGGATVDRFGSGGVAVNRGRGSWLSMAFRDGALVGYSPDSPGVRVFGIPLD